MSTFPGASDTTYRGYTWTDISAEKVYTFVLSTAAIMLASVNPSLSLVQSFVLILKRHISIWGQELQISYHDYSNPAITEDGFFVRCHFPAVKRFPQQNAPPGQAERKAVKPQYIRLIFFPSSRVFPALFGQFRPLPCDGSLAPQLHGPSV